MSTVPVVGQTFTFGVGVFSQSNANLLQNNPSIQAGDFQRSIGGGAFANLTNLPVVTPAGGRRIQIVISAAETTSAGAGGEIWVRWVDAAGAEWFDSYCILIVHATDLDSLATATALATAQVDLDNPNQYKADVSGLATAIDLATVDGNVDAILLDTGTDGVKVAAGGISPATFAPGAVDAAAIATDAIDADALSNDALAEIAAAVLAVGTVFPAGAIEFTYTVTDVTTGNPIEGAEVWISTDAGGANIVWKGDTDVFGVARDVNGARPWLDAGLYAFWAQKGGYGFSPMPDWETVS